MAPLLVLVLLVPSHSYTDAKDDDAPPNDAGIPLQPPPRARRDEGEGVDDPRTRTDALAVIEDVPTTPRGKLIVEEGRFAADAAEPPGLRRMTFDIAAHRSVVAISLFRSRSRSRVRRCRAACVRACVCVYVVVAPWMRRGSLGIYYNELNFARSSWS